MSRDAGDAPTTRPSRVSEELEDEDEAIYFIPPDESSDDDPDNIDDGVFTRDTPARRGFRGGRALPTVETIYDVPRMPPRRCHPRRSSPDSSRSEMHTHVNVLYESVGQVPSQSAAAPASEHTVSSQVPRHRPDPRRPLMSDSDAPPSCYDQDGYALIPEEAAFRTISTADGGTDGDEGTPNPRPPAAPRAPPRRRHRHRSEARSRSSPGFESFTQDQREELLSRPLPPLPAVPPPLPVSRTKRRSAHTTAPSVASEPIAPAVKSQQWKVSHSAVVTRPASPTRWRRDVDEHRFQHRPRLDKSQSLHRPEGERKSRLRKLLSTEELGRPLNRLFASAREELRRRRYGRSRLRSTSLDRETGSGSRDYVLPDDEHRPPSAPASVPRWRSTHRTLEAAENVPLPEPGDEDDEWESLLESELATMRPLPPPPLPRSDLPPPPVPACAHTFPLGIQPAVLSPTEAEFLERCVHRNWRSHLRHLSNTGPQLPWNLESLFVAVPSQRAASMAGLAMPAVTVLTMLNHHYVNFRRLNAAQTTVSRTFAQPGFAALRDRLVQLIPEDLGGSSNPVVALLGQPSVRGSQIRMCLRILEALLSENDTEPQERRRVCRQLFRDINPCMASAAYSDVPARRLYASNLAELNRDDRDEREPLPLLCVAPQQASPEMIIHDAMFCLSLSNLLYAWQMALELQHQVLQLLWERLAETCYLAYLQMPMLRQPYLILSAEIATAVTPVHEGDGGANMFSAAQYLLRFMRHAQTGQVHFSSLYVSSLVRAAALDNAGYRGYSAELAARALAVPAVLTCEHEDAPSRRPLPRQMCLMHSEALSENGEPRPLPTTHIDLTHTCTDMMCRAIELLSRSNNEPHPRGRQDAGARGRDRGRGRHRQPHERDDLDSGLG